MDNSIPFYMQCKKLEHSMDYNFLLNKQSDLRSLLVRNIQAVLHFELGLLIHHCNNILQCIILKYLDQLFQCNNFRLYM